MILFFPPSEDKTQTWHTKTTTACLNIQPVCQCGCKYAVYPDIRKPWLHTAYPTGVTIWSQQYKSYSTLTIQSIHS